MAWEWLGPTTTAAVAVVGIAGTVTVAALSRRAQLEVARAGQVQLLMTEKRLIYTKYLRLAQDAVDRAKEFQVIQSRMIKIRVLVADHGEHGADLEKELQDLNVRVNEFTGSLARLDSELRYAQSDISIIGGLRMGVLALNVASAVHRSAYEDEPVDFNEPLTDLILAMHADIDPHAKLEPTLNTIFKARPSD